MPLSISDELKSYITPSDIITGQGQKVMKDAGVDTIASPNNSLPVTTSPEFKHLNGITDVQQVIDKEKERRYLERRKTETNKQPDPPIVNKPSVDPEAARKRQEEINKLYQEM